MDVRKTAFDCIGYLLKFMAPKYLKQFEANLVSLLLMGLSDESEDNQMKCIVLL